MSFLDGPWNIDTLKVLGVVALLLLLDGTLGADIIDRGTVLLDLNRTFSSLDLFLNLLLNNLAGFVLDIRTGLVRNFSALLPGHRLKGGSRNLATNLLRNLPTNRL